MSVQVDEPFGISGDPEHEPAHRAFEPKQTQLRQALPPSLGRGLEHSVNMLIAGTRAAVRRALILILDEPTVALNEENERLVTASLGWLNNQSTLLITHDLRFALRADKILYLDKDRVTEAGSHERLMGLDERHAALYRLQTLTHMPTQKSRHAYAS